MDGIEVVTNVGEDYKPGVSLYGLICFIYGHHASHLAEMTAAERKNAICTSLAKYYDTPDAHKVILQQNYVENLPYCLSKFQAFMDIDGQSLFLSHQVIRMQKTKKRKKS